MRIVVINDFLAAGSGGAGVAVLRTFRHLATRADVDAVTVIGFRSDLTDGMDQVSAPRFKVELWPGMHVSWWNNRDGMVLLPSNMITNRLRELMPDVLVTAAPTPVCIQALQFARRRSIPSVYISQTQGEVLQPYMPRWLGASIAPALVKSITRILYPAFAKADAVVFPTKTARNLITQAVRSSSLKAKAKVISNGVDTSIYCPSGENSGDLRAGSPKLLFVGRLMRDKMPDMPIRALARLRSRGVAATLTILGRGPLEGSLRRLAADLDVSEYVRFMGLVPEGTVIRQLQEATVTIVPSFAETQSLVMLESVACGTPVVSADAPTNAASLFIRSQRCGEVYRYDDPEALAETLLNLVSEQRRYDECRARCLAVRHRFSLDGVTAQWLRLCQALRSDKCCTGRRAAV